MYCCNCGKKLEDEDRFCDQCGTPVYEEGNGEGGHREEAPEPPEAAAGREGAAGTRDPGTSGPEAAGEEKAGEITVPEREPDPEPEEEEKTVVLEKVQDSASAGGAEGEPPCPEPGAALSDLEKKIMKNMEDELILTMPETVGPDRPSYGTGQRPSAGPAYGNVQDGPQGRRPYGPYPAPGGQEAGSGEQPVRRQGEGGKPPQKKKKTLIIALSCVVAVLAVTVGILVFLLLSPENKLKQCVEDRDWSAAAGLYEDRFRGEEKKEEKAGEILREAVDALREEFAAGTMDYPTVKRHLKGIEDFWDDSYVEDALDFVRELNDSREAFEEAEQCMGREEYEDAIRLYGEVANFDPAYGSAREKLETAKDRYKEKLLGEAQAYTEIGDYDSAIGLVEEGLEVLAGDAELKSRLDELQGEQVQYRVDAVLKEAAGYAGQGSYYDALEEVREGLLENAGNGKLEAALKEYSEKYKQDILKKAEEAAGTDENYEAAILVFDSALNTLDGDYAQIEQAIREKREEYVQLQLEKSQRENEESAIVGTWHGVSVAGGDLEIPMDQFLSVSGMPGAAVLIDCQPSGSFHIDMFGQVGDGTWQRDGAGNGVYHLDIEGSVQAVQIDTSGRLHMDFDGVAVIFEKTGEA